MCSPRKILSLAYLRLHSGHLHQTCIVLITCLVPYAVGNYKLRMLMHTGMEQNTFSYIISS